MRFALIGLMILAGCTDSPAARLRAAYPEHADAILAGAEQIDVPRANGMRMTRVGVAEFSFALSSGFAVTVRERGVRGETHWTTTEIGFEEWLHVDPPIDGNPVAVWTVEGGTFRRRGPDVELVDGAGRAQLVVRAPRGHQGTRPLRLRLESHQNELSLFADGSVDGVRLLIDPAWKPVSAPVVGRAQHTATLLPSGKVLVAGGTESPMAELYDPVADMWIDAGTMLVARRSHSATLLQDGRVLVTFGFFAGSPAVSLSTAELFDADAGAFSDAGTWRTAFSHPAVLLPDGRVMVAAALVGFFDPSSGTWADGPIPSTPNWNGFGQSLTLLPSGKVFATSGLVAEFNVYDPTSNSWSIAAPSASLTQHHFAGVVSGGRLLKVAEGVNAELYDPVGNAWVDAGNPGPAGGYLRHSTVVLPNGDALTTGPYGSSRFSADSGLWSDAGQLPVPMGFHTATVLPSGLVLLVGGLPSGAAQLHDPTFGRSCLTAADCLTGLCIDGVCCESSCVGSCNRCDLPEATGECRSLDAGVSGTPECSPYLCGGAAACSTSCVADESCALGFFCATGSCVAALGQGTACGSSRQCDAGFCVDGVCCDTACGGGIATDCLACNRDAGVGTCGFSPPAHVCRPPVVACDAPESCTGTSPTCPIDQALPMGTVCRASAGVCDPAEVCDGFIVPCPADKLGPPTTLCRLAAGTCDLEESCSGTSAVCPADRFEDAGSLCRPVGGVCDGEEVCAGDSAQCPTDRPAADGTTCIKGGTCLGGTCMEKIPTPKDAGTTPAIDAGLGPAAPSRGCGCGATDGPYALVLLAFVLAGSRHAPPAQRRPVR